MSTSFDPISVAIQGELGSNSALAAEQFFATEVTIVPCAAFLFNRAMRCSNFATQSGQS